MLLIPLAATSTNGMMKRLGGKCWQQLHRLVYFISGGGMVHCWWLVKKDITLLLIYGGVLAPPLRARLAYAGSKKGGRENPRPPSNRTATAKK